MRLLPRFHIMTIAIIALLVLIVLFFWPAATTPPVNIPVSPQVQNQTTPPDDPIGNLVTERQLMDDPQTPPAGNLLPQDNNLPPVDLSAAAGTTPSPANQADQPVTTLPVAAEQAGAAASVPSAAPAAASATPPADRRPSQRFTVKKGQTIAQVFRNNGLPVDDLFRMTAVEGPQKPLNQVEAGEKIRIIRGSDNTVAELLINKNNGQSVTFKRQKNGSYRRL